MFKTKTITQQIPEIRMLNLKGCEHFFGWIKIIKFVLINLAIQAHIVNIKSQLFQKMLKKFDSGSGEFYQKSIL